MEGLESTERLLSTILQFPTHWSTVKRINMDPEHMMEEGKHSVRATTERISSLCYEPSDDRLMYMNKNFCFFFFHEF